MNGSQTRVLVVYSTWTGVTRQIAEAVAKRLETEGASVDLGESAAVMDVRPYDAIVLGCSVHAGKVTRHSIDFAKRFGHDLARKPVAWFLVSLTMATDTLENRRKAMEYLEPVCKAAPEVRPIAVGLFGGAVLTNTEDYEHLFYPMKLIAGIVRKTDPVDHRDWAAIDAWAGALLPAFEIAAVPTPA